MRIIEFEIGNYKEIWKKMIEFTETRTKDTQDELWITEHNPIYTLGKNANENNIIDAGDIPVLRVDRGGEVTYHGPGQIIIYVLIDLKRKGLNVSDLIFILEESIIQLLKKYNISANRMKKAPGVGLAANQIGILKKIITVHIFNEEKKINKTYALFNPIIKSYSKETIVMEEGCLSFPKQFIDIERPSSIEIEYLDQNNNLIKEEKEGYEARILQHEVDHLYGKLFVDYLSTLKKNKIIKRVQKLKKIGEI